MPSPVSVECLLCERGFTLDDVSHFNYFLANGICYDCLRKLYKLPEDQSCFGKKYDPVAPECKRMCPDRKVCPLFQFGEIKKLRKANVHIVNKTKPDRQHPFKPGTAIRKIFDFCRLGCTRAELHKLTIKLNVNMTWALGVLRREELYNHTWTWKDRDGKLSVTFPKK